MFVNDENRTKLGAEYALMASNIYVTWNPIYDNCLTTISEISVIFDTIIFWTRSKSSLNPLRTDKCSAADEAGDYMHQLCPLVQ